MRYIYDDSEDVAKTITDAVSPLVHSCMLGMLGVGFIAAHSLQTQKDN